MMPMSPSLWVAVSYALPRPQIFTNIHENCVQARHLGSATGGSSLCSEVI